MTRSAVLARVAEKRIVQESPKGREIDVFFAHAVTICIASGTEYRLTFDRQNRLRSMLMMERGYSC